MNTDTQNTTSIETVTAVEPQTKKAPMKKAKAKSKPGKAKAAKKAKVKSKPGKAKAPKKAKKAKAEPRAGVLIQCRMSEATAKRLTRMAKAKGLRGRSELARNILEAAR